MADSSLLFLMDGFTHIEVIKMCSIITPISDKSYEIKAVFELLTTEGTELVQTPLHLGISKLDSTKTRPDEAEISDGQRKEGPIGHNQMKLYLMTVF